ncbi:ABC transporter ATP-binding protein [Raineyella sp. LH-20]|uniref:ABC transporter ATP-binding protein n=1 Tax=Raineyella sp. LH-20 TaxID=3081204 RepID=UPI002953850A|nr:ATP-binding cassette domain-containing protein [Raineyella sp. LH-20]WOP19813.1 ATP-binding cassette domain-containing protein [Raineyella sp. LH-20]
MIEFSHLTVHYPGVDALTDVSFSVAPGSVTGVLGPNGAGKSTALRILLGLGHADSGHAHVAGRRYAELPAPGRVVGGLVDADAFHPGRTGRESLRLACWTIGLPASRAEEVLAEVGLTPAAGRRVGGYSLGMRQRLGIAQALLGDPVALVLDEPANGLDPQGQRWLADLLRARAERGCAVLLSSHALSEVERVADRLVIIGAGRVLADDRLDVLRTRHASVEDLYFDLTA